MARAVTGILHLHTEYSYDGSSSLKEIATLARKKGHSFLLLTEHSDGFHPERMEKFVSDCRGYSSPELILIPGLEVECGFGRHVLAVGIKEYIPTADPDSVVAAIREKGGLAILPHPGVYQFRSFITAVNLLNGVEVWNTRYDSKYAPNPRSFLLLEALRSQNPDIFAYGGQDLHSVGEFDDLCLQIEPATLSEFEILFHLEKGRFKIARRRIAVNAAGDITNRQRVYFDLASSVHMLGKSLWGKSSKEAV